MRALKVQAKIFWKCPLIDKLLTYQIFKEKKTVNKVSLILYDNFIL